MPRHRLKLAHAESRRPHARGSEPGHDPRVERWMERASALASWWESRHEQPGTEHFDSERVTTTVRLITARRMMEPGDMSAEQWAASATLMAILSGHYALSVGKPENAHACADLAGAGR